MERFGPSKRRSRKPEDPEWVAFMSDDARKAEAQQRLLESPLAGFNLAARTVNTLEANDIHKIGDLAQRTREELGQLPNFGDTTIRECRQLLDGLGIGHPNWNKPPRRKKKVRRAKKK